ncbi:MAG: tetratricopeptide repeat protein [Micavibrio sp.]
MSDIFREVDEALQREKAAAFWKSYGPTLMLAAIVLVGSTAITTAYRYWDTSRNQSQTARLITAANEEDFTQAMEEAARDTTGAHAAVAYLNAAHKAAADADFARAAELYEDAAAQSRAPSTLKDLAVILSVRAALMQAQTTGNEAAHEELAKKLEPVARKKNSAFAMQAGLDAAALYGEGLKDYGRALDLLKPFTAAKAADNTPDSLLEKAEALVHVYEYERARQQENSGGQE